MRHSYLLVVLALLFPFGTRGQEVPTPGAKDLFYDPSLGATASLRLTSPEPAPVKEGPQKAPKGKAGPREAVHPAAHLPSKAASGYAGTRQNIGLHSWIELEEPDGQWSYVSFQEVFHSGQRIRLHFVSNVDGRILLIQLGASGTSSVLFPDSEKGLVDNQLKAGIDRVLPSEEHWFRFDANPGTERLIALFASDADELERFAARKKMRPEETSALIQSVSRSQGSKDLVIETETRPTSEVGTYGVNTKGEPVVLEISLQHR
jgi:hypothetical protein